MPQRVFIFDIIIIVAGLLCLFLLYPTLLLFSFITAYCSHFNLLSRCTCRKNCIPPSCACQKKTLLLKLSTHARDGYDFSIIWKLFAIGTWHFHTTRWFFRLLCECNLRKELYFEHLWFVENVTVLYIRVRCHLCAFAAVIQETSTTHVLLVFSFTHAIFQFLKFFHCRTLVNLLGTKRSSSCCIEGAYSTMTKTEFGWHMCYKSVNGIPMAVANHQMPYALAFLIVWWR